MPVPKLAWNSRLASTAGRFGPGIPWHGTRPIIEVAAYLRELADGELHVRDTVLHEMIHYWLWHQGLPYGHTAEFHAKMKITGAKRFNPVPKIRPIKHHYQCRECKNIVPARRRLADVACSRCCNQFNGGVFSREYRLELIANPAQTGASGFPAACESDGDEDTDLDSDEGFVLPIDKVMDKLYSIREILKNARIRR